MRKAIVMTVLCFTVLSGTRATESAASPPNVVARGASAAVDDSLPGVLVECTDFRGGPSLAFQAQRIRSDGTIDDAWSAGSRFCLGATDGVAPVQVSDGAGGLLIIWVDDRTGEADLRAQRFVSGGGLAPGWPLDGIDLCRAPGAQQDPAACSDGAGGAIVVWQDFRSDGSGDLFAQRVIATGAVLWDPAGMALSAAPGEQGSVTCASDGAGGAFVAWQDRRDDDAAIRVLRMDGTGLVIVPEVPLASGSRPHRAPRIAGDGAGGAYVAWLAGEGRVLALRLGSQGEPAAGWPSAGVVASAQDAAANSMTLVAHDTAGVSLLWSDRSHGNGDIVAQRLRGDGTLAWAPGGVALSQDAAEQFAPAAVADTSGGLIVAWEDHREGPADIVAARLTAQGVLAWDSAGVAVCRLAGEQFDVALVSDGAGGALAAWSDARWAGRASLSRSQPLPSGPAPKLARVETGPGRARLTYRSAAGDARVLDWSRRTEAEWHVVRRVQAAADGEIVAEDRTVSPGALARYRLSQPLGDGELLFDETSVVIPGSAPLMLRSARVDAGRLRVSFSLSSEDPAKLEVLDVQGRRIWNEAVGHLGAGDHETRFSFDGAAGLYFVRLLQRRETRTLRMVVIR